ncbi:FtsX-like permease family protein [Kitasatospora sp. NPDC093806]|uniref:ABC transporter permease n=1 Tax=Kitasatospora sp. NPDC093806 TaxID=3155075 RepID=UPI00341DB59F
MIRLALQTLRHHKGGFVGSFIALFLGAALVMGCGALMETGIHNAAPPERLAAAPVVVTGDQSYAGTRRDTFQERIRIDAGLAARIGSVPGVTETVPGLSFGAALLADGGGSAPKATGFNWSAARLAPYRLAEGSAPEQPGRIALGTALAASAGVKPGDKVRLVVRGEPAEFQVTGLVDGPAADRTLFVSDAEAGKVSGHPGQADSIGVLTAPDTAPGPVKKAVAAALAGSGQPLKVLTGDERGRAENPEVIKRGQTLITLSAVFGGLSASVAVFVVAGTLGLSIQQRRRELALLRAIGTTPGQLRRLVLGETLFLAVIATALATVPGPWVGRLLLDAFASAGVVPESIAFRAGWVPQAAGAGVALITALGAAFIASRSAARTRPTEALAEASLQRRWFNWTRLVFAVLFLVGGAALGLVTANMDGPQAGSTAIPGAMLWTAGFGLLGPGMAKLAATVLRAPLRAFTGLAGRLATLNTRARASRTAAAVLPVMLASGLATAMIYLQTTQTAGAQEAFTDNLKADLVVASATGGLPLSLVDEVGRVPGVAAASAQLSSAGYLAPPEPPAGKKKNDDRDDRLEPTEVLFQGVTAAGVAATTGYRVSSGDLGALTGDTVALPTGLGGHKVGDQVPMRLGDGTRVTLRVVATVDARRGYETALLPAGLLAAHTDEGTVQQILVSAAPGTDTGRLRASLAALGDRHPGLRVATRATVEAGHAKEADTQTWMSFLVVAMVIGYATIALVNTQVLATTERRREFMLQRLIGASKQQIIRMMTVESVLVAGSGVLLGLVVAAATLIPLSLSVLGSPVPEGPLWILPTVIGAAVALTLGTTLLCTTLTLRGRPAEAAGSPE